MKTPLLIVDDHSVIREGLRRILDETGHFECYQATSGEDALTLLDENERLQLVLMDITLPGMNGLDALCEIKARHPHVKVLMLSMHPEERFAVRSIRMGASGYLSKSSSGGEITEALRKVQSGETAVSQVVHDLIQKTSEDSQNANLHEILSDREYQILCMIGSGKSVTEISALLNLSAKTVSTHRERILRKMNFNGNVDIIRYALLEGLLT